MGDKWLPFIVLFVTLHRTKWVDGFHLLPTINEQLFKRTDEVQLGGTLNNSDLNDKNFSKNHTGNINDDNYLFYLINSLENIAAPYNEKLEKRSEIGKSNRPEDATKPPTESSNIKDEKGSTESEKTKSGDLESRNLPDFERNELAFHTDKINGSWALPFDYTDNSVHKSEFENTTYDENYIEALMKEFNSFLKEDNSSDYTNEAESIGREYESPLYHANNTTNVTRRPEFQQLVYKELPETVALNAENGKILPSQVEKPIKELHTEDNENGLRDGPTTFEIKNKTLHDESFRKVYKKKDEPAAFNIENNKLIEELSKMDSDTVNEEGNNVTNSKSHDDGLELSERKFPEEQVYQYDIGINNRPSVTNIDKDDVEQLNEKIFVTDNISRKERVTIDRDLNDAKLNTEKEFEMYNGGHNKSPTAEGLLIYSTLEGSSGKSMTGADTLFTDGDLYNYDEVFDLGMTKINRPPNPKTRSKRNIVNDYNNNEEISNSTSFNENQPESESNDFYEEAFKKIMEGLDPEKLNLNNIGKGNGESDSVVEQPEYNRQEVENFIRKLKPDGENDEITQTESYVAASQRYGGGSKFLQSTQTPNNKEQLEKMSRNVELNSKKEMLRMAGPSQ